LPAGLRKKKRRKPPAGAPAWPAWNLTEGDGAPSTIDLRESVSQAGESLAVEGNCIRGVKVLGLESKNCRRYLAEALREAAGVYNGLRININHPAKPGDPRAFGDRFGWLENVRLVDGDGLRGDLHYNPEHPDAKSFAWWAANRPDMIGLSHNAIGQGHNEAGTFVVDKIVKVRSVDLVADPASTRGLMS
jgi:hypothetical protein